MQFILDMTKPEEFFEKDVVLIFKDVISCVHGLLKYPHLDKDKLSSALDFFDIEEDGTFDLFKDILQCIVLNEKGVKYVIDDLNEYTHASDKFEVIFNCDSDSVVKAIVGAIQESTGCQFDCMESKLYSVISVFLAELVESLYIYIDSDAIEYLANLGLTEMQFKKLLPLSYRAIFDSCIEVNSKIHDFDFQDSEQVWDIMHDMSNDSDISWASVRETYESKKEV